MSEEEGSTSPGVEEVQFVVCAWCGASVKPNLPVVGHLRIEITHGICDPCGKRLEEEGVAP